MKLAPRISRNVFADKCKKHGTANKSACHGTRATHRLSRKRARRLPIDDE